MGRIMMPLGLDADQLDAYHARLFAPHDFDIDIDVLYLDEQQRGQLTGEFIDGQINLQRDGAIARTATFSLHDPDHAINLDAESPFDGAVFFDRMVRVRHTVDLDGLAVEAIPFVGPITKISRVGSVLSIECQDKAALASEGRPPMTRKKGANAVDAIKGIMRACGETRFRFITSDETLRKRLPKDYSTGWTTEASPWAICQKIASHVLGMQLVYACDGALLLRKVPSTPVLTFDLTDITGQVAVDYDASKVRNHVRVTGTIPANTKRKTKARKFTETATAAASHPMSPSKLGRNDVPRYLPLLIDDSNIKKHKDAQARADSELASALPLDVTAQWGTVPVFHLDTGDRIKLATPDGEFITPWVDVALPAAVGGDASIGALRRVSKPQRIGSRAA